MNGIRDMILTFAKNYLPEIYGRINDENLQSDTTEKMILSDVLPESIKSDLPENSDQTV